MNYFSKNLKYLIKLFPTTQEQLALYLNKNQTTISNWINEVSTADVRDIIKIHEYFGISLDALVLVDLKNSKVITDEHIQDFTRISKVNGKNVGKVQAVSKGYLGGEEGDLSMLEDPGSVATWSMMGSLKIMDGKLDQLRTMAEELLKKSGK